MTIQIDGLSKIYPDGTEALKDINLSIPAGIVGLLGPNGAGKSTLMKILTTVLESTSGKARIYDLDHNGDRERIRTITGYLPQEYGLYNNLTAEEFLDYIGLFYKLKKDTRRERIEYLLKRVNLFQAKDKKLKTYSGGMKRRLGIAQALLNNPRVLIIDEPTAGLDPEERIKFRGLLRELLLEDRERIVIFSTHIVNDITALSSRVIILNKGRIEYEGRISQLLQKAAGRVWEISTDQRGLARIEENEIIINSRIENDERFKIRFLSTAEYPGAVGVEPELEDAYIYLLGESRTVREAEVQ